MVKTLKSFFKFGIVVFVVISAIAGYGVGFTVEQSFSWIHLLSFILGTFLISSGSLAFNQVQEAHKDAKMPRTQSRPIPSGIITKKMGITISVTHMVLGTLLLYFMVKPLTAYIGLFIIVLYNGLYTLHWKPKMMFAAVPGAIPGALPAVLGYSAVNSNIFSSESIYLFLIMFLWQMPHFWTLAIRFKEDYSQGEFPVLPSVVGKERTLYHISFYVWAYAFLAIASPFFVDFSYSYFIIVLPFAVKVVWEFLKYYNSTEEKSWLYFFLWTNFSIMAFLFAPLVDKWTPMLFHV
jgi:protoheme IX farnesyltransferase